MSHFVSLAQFREVTALPAEAVLWLLSQGLLTCELVPSEPQNGTAVRVDIESLTTEASVRALYESAFPPGSTLPVLVKERISSVVATFMDQVIDTAMIQLNQRSAPAEVMGVAEHAERKGRAD